MCLPWPFGIFSGRLLFGLNQYVEQMIQISENNLKLTDEVYNCSCLVELACGWDVITL